MKNLHGFYLSSAPNNQSLDKSTVLAQNTYVHTNGGISYGY